MATGRSNQLTKQIGEFLVCAELSRLGFITTPFAGNVPDFDVLAIDDKLNIIPVQVKAIRGGSWQFDGTKFLNIRFRRKGDTITQIVEGKKQLPSPGLIYIFVKIGSAGSDEFYILKLADIQDIIFTKYSDWLFKHGGKRPRKPDSTHNSVLPKDLSKFRDNWQLIMDRRLVSDKYLINKRH
jgi:hypothetical protein